MNFDFSEDEKLIRDHAARFLSEQCTPTVVRSVLEGEAPYAETVWQGLVEMGLPATSIPESLGGAGAGRSALCLVAEQLGATLAPTPLGTTLYLFAEALMLAGSDSQKASYLPRISKGELTGTCAVVESLVELSPDQIEATVSYGKLNGTKLIVANGGIVDKAVVLARNANAELSFYIVDLTGDGITRETVNTVDPTSNAAQITFKNVAVEPLGETGAGWSLLTTLYDRAAVYYAFEQLGGAQRALDMAIDYAKQRFAFGRPIGSFQALKHMIADMYVALKLAESNCYYAAWALSENSDELPVAAATARVSATKAFQLCASDNIQTHGGMGFTWEFDCHLYYRRSNYLALLLGGLSSWEQRLVSSIQSAA